MANEKKRRDFDQGKLEKLGQPFSVTVEQDIGGRRTPIALPPLDRGIDPGKGYTPDAARALGELLPRLGGGGLYVVKAIDDAQNMVEWEWWFDPTILPRVPSAAVASAAAAHQAPAVVMAPAHAGMAPQMVAAASLAQPVPPQAPPFAWWLEQQRPPQPPPAPPMFGLHPGPGAAPAPAPTDPFGNPLWQEREKSLRLEYEMKLQQAQAAARAELAATAQRLEQGQVAAQQAHQAALRPATDPALEARIAAAEQRAAEAEQRARQATEDAKRDRERSEILGVISASEARMTAALEQITARLAQVAQTAHAPTGPDPTILLLTETIKANAELNRETLRSITDSMKDSARGQMTLGDVMNVMRQINDQSGSSTVTKQLSENYSSMLGMVREIIELNSQMRGPGENPLVGMGTEAIAKVSEGVQAYIQSKRDEAVAKENASALRAQAQAASNAAVANANAAAMRPAPVAPAPQAAPAAAQGPVQGAEETAPENEGAEDAPTEVQGAGTNGTGEMAIDRREREIFGAAAESIMHLRAGVMTGKLNPLQVAQAIAQGAARLRALKMTPPVFRMYEEKIYASVVEALLPEAPPDFRRAVTEILNSAARMEAEEAAAPAVPAPSN